MPFHRAVLFTVIAALSSVAMACNDSVTAPKPPRSLTREQFAADFSSQLIVRTSTGVTISPVVREHYAVTAAGIARSRIPSAPTGSKANADKLLSAPKPLSDAAPTVPVNHRKVRGRFIWGEHRNGSDYGLQAADEAGNAPSAGSSHRPPRYFILWKDAKVIRVVHLNYTQKGSRWEVSDGVVADIGADGRWTAQRTFAITNRVPLTESSSFSKKMRDGLARLASHLVPGDLNAQTVSTYDPFACLMDELGLAGVLVEPEIGLLDIFDASLNIGMMAVDCGEVIDGEADPNVYTLPTIYVTEAACMPFTWTFDVYVDDIYVGTDYVEGSTCDNVNQE